MACSHFQEVKNSNEINQRQRFENAEKIPLLIRTSVSTFMSAIEAALSERKIVPIIKIAPFCTSRLAWFQKRL